jgi:hypothetical protein
MTPSYKVRSIDWMEDEDAAFETKWAYDEESAVIEWCEYLDKQSGFADGYPDDHEVEVIAPDGTASRYTVSTDWSPSFYANQKS